MVKEINNINAGNNLKEELVTTLKNLLPICNNPAWLKRETQTIENRELDDSYCLMSDIATVLARQWMEKQPEVFQEKVIETYLLEEFDSWLQKQPELFHGMNTFAPFIYWLLDQLKFFQDNLIETHTLREFIRMCHANIEIIFDPNETIEETTNKILNEMYQHKNKPTRSTR